VSKEIGGWTITPTLAEDNGTADTEGLMPGGILGGHVAAEHGPDRRIMSFTVPATNMKKTS
jgi:hypothetical protein